MEASRRLKAPRGWNDVSSRSDLETGSRTFAQIKYIERQVTVGPFYPSKEINAQDGWCVYVFTREVLLASEAFRHFKTRKQAEAHALGWMKEHPDG